MTDGLRGKQYHQILPLNAISESEGGDSLLLLLLPKITKAKERNEIKFAASGCHDA